MNTGVISSRYARALLRLCNDNADAPESCRQALVLLDAFAQLPRLHVLLSDSTAISAEEKMGLLHSALGPDTPMTPSLERFFALVQQNGRMPLLRLMLHTFTDLYYREKGIRCATLTTAIPPTEELLKKYRAAAERRFGGTVQLESVTDPSIIGGAILTVDGWCLDASISGQLERLRNELKEKNKRIV